MIKKFFSKYLLNIFVSTMVATSLMGCSQPNNMNTANTDNIVEQVNVNNTNEKLNIEKSHQFETIDLNNDIVTEDVFNKNDLTIVFYWATYCSACKEEMSDLEELYNSMVSENINVLGIVSTHSKDENGKRTIMSNDEIIDIATPIIDQYNVTFPNIITNDDITEYLGVEIYSFPTIFFINNQGQLIENSIIEYNDINMIKENLDYYLEYGYIELQSDVSQDIDNTKYLYEIGENITLENGTQIICVLNDNNEMIGLPVEYNDWYTESLNNDMTDIKKEEFYKKLDEVSIELPKK